MSGMTADPPLATFVAALRQSRLIDAPDIDRLAARHATRSGRAFAEVLIRSGVLTHYQADKLLRGVWQGLVLGPYHILAPLGRGGMGTVVYLARDRRQAEELGDVDLVALKLLPHRKTAHDLRILARFRREMALGHRVNHANVVRTLGAGEIDAVHYLALEFVPGRTLRQVVADGGPLAVGDAARVFADVASGLAHLHARRLVHRDLKPTNIMVRPDGRAVVLDLGLALSMGETLPDDPTIVGGRGYVVGTMDYLPPEQAVDAAAVGPPADLYGLGCALAFALTGSVPFPAATTKEKVLKHRTEPPPPLDGVPPAFRQIVHRLMAKLPAQRYGSAAEVREVLARWATAAPARSAVDALTLADAPHGDAGLWDAAPGEEVPTAERLEEPPEVLELPPEETNEPRARTGCAGVVLLGLVLGGLIFICAI
ncbi:serine/threonine protein kinase [Gemmata sp. JC673]|uniref:Serine/threonine protein kinase n=1 Tax=Gemmata algarum TaxID=2975278 RepID=A0ABU5F539_9BACT|nr:serine/threonine-protein kinase [Gemmata algarum]MDY3561855.1 serine/threonine protein kinase [Gemmata algarum]